MNPITLEWVDKAEDNYITVELLLQSPIASKDVICFHAQQCIEKYLKAWLQEANIPAPRTHMLEDLLNLIVPSIPEWQTWNQDFSTLSNHAVAYHAVALRYPGKSATAENLQHAVKTCKIVREAVRKSLKLPQVDIGD